VDSNNGSIFAICKPVAIEYIIALGKRYVFSKLLVYKVGGQLIHNNVVLKNISEID